MIQRRVRSKPAAVFDAISYGPVGFIQSAVIGFIVASLLFLIGDASVNQHNVVQELPLFLLIVAAGALAGLLVAVVLNYQIGRQIRDERELEKRVSAGSPNPVAKPKPRALDISPANGRPGADFRADRAA
jgi:hypothetical protein